jgi:ribosomal protein S18 acetylase RimI-like enzyme
MAESCTGAGIFPAIVTASWHDLRDLYDMERTCFQLDAWPLLDVLGVLTFPQVIRLKAVSQGKMVGFIAADLRRSQATAWIATLAVLPECRQQGLGKALLKACEAEITLPKIRLCVRRSNTPAIHLYLKSDYQQVDIWKAYYRGGDDALVFEKNLQPGSLFDT